MLSWKQVAIEDKEMFDAYFRKGTYDISELVFTSFILWTPSYDLKYVIVEEALCIKITYKEEEPFMWMPLGAQNLKSVLDILRQDSEKKNESFILRSLSEQMIEEIKAVVPDQFSFIPERDRSDYVYSVQNLIELKGNKYYSKKKQVRDFKANNKYVYTPLSSENLGDIIEATRRWNKAYNETLDEHLENEEMGILNIIKEYENLDYSGAILTIDDEIVAFTIGEALSEDTAIIHIEKANKAIRGAYAAVNNLYLENQWKQMTYVNRQDDAGVENLRKAKLLYYPVKMVDKYKGEIYIGH